MFALAQYHHWSLNELNDLIPWEKEIYLSLLINHIKDEEEKQKRERHKSYK